MQSVAAKEFGIPLERVKVNATDTSKVPNTSATAASAGADLNGMAVKNAVDILKGRLIGVFLKHFEKETPASRAEDVVFEEDQIFDQKNPSRVLSFPEIMPMAHFQQVSLSTTGFYRTPNVGFDPAKGKGRPFHYFAFGMAVSEIELDVLTGHQKPVRTDILHDVGDSLNPHIDIGQVEGAYVQGVGWCTTEDVKWNDQGHLLAHSPDTYKIPSVRDIPLEFHTHLSSSLELSK